MSSKLLTSGILRIVPSEKAFERAASKNELLAIGPAEIAVFVVAGAGEFQGRFAVESLEALL